MSGILNGFACVPALKAGLKAAAKLRKIKATRRQRWIMAVERYKSRRFCWPWTKPLTFEQAKQRIRADYMLDNPDAYGYCDEQRCKEVLTLFRSGTRYVYLTADTLRAIEN